METKQLTSVPETMLITVWAKAVETKNKGGLLYDELALKMIDHIDYDFSKFKNVKISQVGCCIRANLIDKETKEFLAQHPDAVVIQLGAGLDARYQRIGCPEVTHWFDLDLKESLDIRRALLPETEKNTYIEMSMFDNGWIDTVKAYHKPVLIIIEGVSMYFSPEKIKAFFCNLCENFEKATILLDILAYKAVKYSKHHDAVKQTNHKAKFLWSILYTKEMEIWHSKLHVGKEYYMSDHEHKRFPLILRLLYKFPSFYHNFNQRIVRLEIR